jgi:transcriptional regulator with XRE-family HTH domain
MSDEGRNKLPELLRRLRARSGMTLREVEEASEGRVSNAYLSQLEQGRRPAPNPRILTALAQVYRVPVQDLFEAAGYVDAPAPSAVDRAYDMVLADSEFSFGTRAPGELSQDAKRMVIELYERATNRTLLSESDDD